MASDGSLAHDSVLRDVISVRGRLGDELHACGPSCGSPRLSPAVQSTVRIQLEDGATEDATTQFELLSLLPASVPHRPVSTVAHSQQRRKPASGEPKSATEAPAAEVWLGGVNSEYSGLYTLSAQFDDKLVWRNEQKQRWLYLSQHSRWIVTHVEQSVRSGAPVGYIVSERAGGRMPYEVSGWSVGGEPCAGTAVIVHRTSLWFVSTTAGSAPVTDALGRYTVLTHRRGDGGLPNGVHSWPVWERDDQERWLAASKHGRSWGVYGLRPPAAGRRLLSSQLTAASAPPEAVPVWATPACPLGGVVVVCPPVQLRLRCNGGLTAPHQGLYSLTSDPGVNGWPLWQRVGSGGDRWLFSTPQGFWRITDDPEDFSAGVGYLITSKPHCGAMPCAMEGGWRLADGRRDEDACVTADRGALTPEPEPSRRRTVPQEGRDIVKRVVRAGTAGVVRCSVADERSRREFHTPVDEQWGAGGFDPLAPPGRRLQRTPRSAPIQHRRLPKPPVDPYPGNWLRTLATLKGPFAPPPSGSPTRQAKRTRASAAIAASIPIDPDTGRAERSVRAAMLESRATEEEVSELHWLQFGRPPPPPTPPEPIRVSNVRPREGEFPECTSAAATVCQTVNKGPVFTTRAPVYTMPRYFPGTCSTDQREGRRRRSSAMHMRSQRARRLSATQTRNSLRTNAASDSLRQKPQQSGGARSATSAASGALQEGQEVSFSQLVHHYHCFHRKLKKNLQNLHDTSKDTLDGESMRLITVSFAGREVSVEDFSHL
eukprot:TRINITY_DN15827_c0_g1_i1.p1 TRINITY_DN15827_c0_g1~~TRINITY_DN15827_c0_g1_i1.p1  ORF type:complete len:768 (+),score=10.89 TRINITY_DN15827_c0_g1_i1:82-2385(+)